MKHLKSTLLLAVVGIAFSALTIYSCTKDEVTSSETNAAQVPREHGEETGEPCEGEPNPDETYEVVEDTQVTDWCVYTTVYARGRNGGTTVKVGDSFCFQCPSGGLCPGVSNACKWIWITNPDGTEELYDLRFNGSGGSCTSCPSLGYKVNKPF